MLYIFLFTNTVSNIICVYYDKNCLYVVFLSKFDNIYLKL